MTSLTIYGNIDFLYVPESEFSAESDGDSHM
jgi:hypothetical protein